MPKYHGFKILKGIFLELFTFLTTPVLLLIVHFPFPHWVHVPNTFPTRVPKWHHKRKERTAPRSFFLAITFLSRERVWEQGMGTSSLRIRHESLPEAVGICKNISAMATEEGEGMRTATVTVRLATRSDVHAIAALIRELADFEELTHACEVTDAKLNASLWKLPPFQGPTVFMLEIGPTREHEEDHLASAEEAEATFEPVVRNVTLRSPIEDPSSNTSFNNGNQTVVGFVLFFPNYSTFLAKSGIYIEDLYVRKPYRGRGFGTILLKTVAQQAVKLGAGRVEWCVLDWNVNAIKFYEGIGAKVMPEWRICRLSGKPLESCTLWTGCLRISSFCFPGGRFLTACERKDADRLAPSSNILDYITLLETSWKNVHYELNYNLLH